MVSRVTSGSVVGVVGIFITVEVDITPGLPGFHIVGLPENAVKESRERVIPAIKNSGFQLPARKITVNLAPADIKKEGTLFDLPIAVGILKALGYIAGEIDYLIVGELSLDGSIRGVRGILPIAVELKRDGVLKGILLPEDNREEASLVDEIDIYPVRNLKEAVLFLRGELSIPPYESNNALLDLFNED
ncbi:MAG: magnesium chelatase domain-containing protein, partial [candidate division WOR-3 bacterium]